MLLMPRCLTLVRLFVNPTPWTDPTGWPVSASASVSVSESKDVGKESAGRKNQKSPTVGPVSCASCSGQRTLTTTFDL